MQSYIEGIVVKFNDCSTKRTKFEMNKGVNITLQAIFCDFYACFWSDLPKVEIFLDSWSILKYR